MPVCLSVHFYMPAFSNYLAVKLIVISSLLMRNFQSVCLVFLWRFGCEGECGEMAEISAQWVADGAIQGLHTTAVRPAGNSQLLSLSLLDGTYLCLLTSLFWTCLKLFRCSFGINRQRQSGKITNQLKFLLNFWRPEFGTNFQREVSLFLEIPKSPFNGAWDGSKEAHNLLDCRLAADRHGQTHNGSIYCISTVHAIKNCFRNHHMCMLVTDRSSVMVWN